MSDSIKVSEIVDSSFKAEPTNPEWVAKAIEEEEFLIVNTTVRLKVGKDEVYATYRDTITIDDNGKFGVQRAEVSGVHS